MRLNPNEWARAGEAVRRRLGPLAAALTVAVLAAGCGGDDDGEDGGARAQELTITVSDNWEIEAPASAEPGLSEITLVNASGEIADAQLVPIEGGRSPEQVVEAFELVVASEAVPEWFGAGGGVAGVEPGSEASVTQVLQPGTYYVLNTFTDEPPEPDSLVAIEVGGEESHEALPEADATVEGFEYGFETEGLRAGASEIRFENTGVEPHHLVAAPIEQGRTIADVIGFFETEEGEPPLDFEREHRSAVLGGGQSQLVALDLEPGTYALLCFIADRAGGPPHVAQGMVAELEVNG